MKFLIKLVRILFRLLYRVEVKGLEYLQNSSDKTLIVANHTSFIDGMLLGVFLPGNVTFAVHSRVVEQPLMNLILKAVKVFPMDPVNPLSIKSLIRYINKGNRALIFPEGRITVTGSLMKIYDGTGLIAIKSMADVLPVRIDGAQYTPFSRLRGSMRIRWFPKIIISILPVQNIMPPEGLKGRERRKYAGKILSDIMTQTIFATSHYHKTIFQALLDAQNIHGRKKVVVEDIQRQPLNYEKVITGAYVLGQKLSQYTQFKENVGVLLPSAVANVVTIFGLHVYGRVPAMLNFTVGSKGLTAACETAQIKVVITSRRFILMAKLAPLIETISEKVKLIYLEDVKQQITLTDKLTGLLRAKTANLTYESSRYCGKPDDPAFILFTSGSEGTPKGVVLSHENLLANREQLASRIDFSAQDIILNALPMFHSFGLTAGTLLPLLSGMKTFFYPSPLHYRIVPEVAYDINATILFGTNTFLMGYAKFAHPYDFYSIRYVFAGAEKLQEEIRRSWSDKFGIRIFEGYGATEASPVISTNTPMENKPGSVGQIMPGMAYHLEAVPGVEEGGRLYVKGPNVMLGYLLYDNPGQLIPVTSDHGDGWYDTGDIVSFESGYIHIQGRAKRFAKIGGEMISLTVVETFINALWPDNGHAVVALPDPQKGEQLILITEFKEANRKAISQQAKQSGFTELYVPKSMIVVDKLPVLGTGKMDYVSAKALAEKEI